MAQAIARFSVIDRVRLRRYRAWIDQARTRFRVTVLSAEPIYRHVVGKVTPGDTQGWFLAHRAYLRRLAEWLDGLRVQPVVYFRRSDEFAASVYKEHVVRRLLTGSERDFKTFVTATAQYYDYSDHIDALRDAFGCVVVRDYDAARRRGLQADFAAQLGAKDLPPPVHAAVRNSPGNKATLWLAAQPEGRSRRDYFRRVLFAVRAARDEPFSEPEPTTLWADTTTFSNFVARHRTLAGPAVLPRCQSGATCHRPYGRRTIRQRPRSRSVIGKRAISIFCGSGRPETWPSMSRIQVKRGAGAGLRVASRSSFSIRR